MRMIPPVIPAPASGAEAEIFALLERSDVGPHAVCLHSVRLGRHAYKREAEVDFLVVGTFGWLVLEVKGGIVQRSADGVWRYTNRSTGAVRTNLEGPFRQAQSATYALRDGLRARIGADVVDFFPFGYGVLLPDWRLDADTVEIEPLLYRDEEALLGSSTLADWIRQLAAHWGARGGRRGDIPPSRVRELVAAIRPVFDRVPNLADDTARINARMMKLTEEQYERLDLLEDSARVLLRGGAGTGKTFLAAEFARRDSDRGRRTLLTCESPVLAGYLATRVQGDNITVKAIREIDPGRAGLFDVIVVDEGQDLLTADGVALLDSVVVGGLEKGMWRVFMDVNNQSCLAALDEDALGLLRESAGAQGSLTRNCRNTQNVVLQTRLTTAADIGTAMAGEGPDVRWKQVADETDEAHAVSDELTRLSSEEVAPGAITILSPVSREQSCVRLLRRKLADRIETIGPALAAQWPLATTTFASIEDFKGIENDVILVVDLEAVDATRRHLALLYVAMSRARAALWIAARPHVWSRIGELHRDNAERVALDAAGAR